MRIVLAVSLGDDHTLRYVFAFAGVDYGLGWLSRVNSNLDGPDQAIFCFQGVLFVPAHEHLIVYHEKEGD